MRLRTRIRAPERFEDEDYDTAAARDAAKPAFPRLLQEQVVAFNPHLSPAAFPSLKQAQPPTNDQDGMSTAVAEPADVDMMDLDHPFHHIFLPTARHGAQLDTHIASSNSFTDTGEPSVFGRSFLDEAATSDEDEEEVLQDHVEQAVADGARSTLWTQLVPSLQVEIFENLCSSRYGYATYDILGLDRDELHSLMKHIQARKMQVVAEDQGIRELQQAQLSAILRKDHAARLTSDSWRDHVALTRRHLPHLLARVDYFICNVAEVRLARRFLDERGIDPCMLGDWGYNKKNDRGINPIQAQVMQAPASRGSIDSGYTSEVAQQETRQSSKAMGKTPLRRALSEISNGNPRGGKAPSSLRRKRPQLMLDTHKENQLVHDHGEGRSTRITDLPASAGLPITSSTMRLWERSSHLTQDDEQAITLMKTRGGGVDKPDVSYDDHHEGPEIRGLPRLKINPPKPLVDGEDANVGSSAPSPGQQAIILKISPKKLQKIQTMTFPNPRPTTVGLSEFVTPQRRTSNPRSSRTTLEHTVPRSLKPMPALRAPFTGQDQYMLSGFSLKLLEIQRDATGLDTLPAFPQLPTRLTDRQKSTSPKRLKLNPPHGIVFNDAKNDAQTLTPYESSSSQRKDSNSSQEAPPWSPITQRSNSLSQSSSKTKPFTHESNPHKFPLVDTPQSAFRLIPNYETDSTIPTHRAPLTLQHHQDLHLKPTIAENGSPVLALPFQNRVSSANVSEKGTNNDFMPRIRSGSSQGFALPRSAQTVSTYPRTPSGWSESGIPTTADSLRTYARNLVVDSPQSSKSSPSRQQIETLARAVPKTHLLAHESGHSLPIISPTEQSVQALLSGFNNKPETMGENLNNQAGEPNSAAHAPSSKTNSLAEEGESPTGGQASSAKKGSEALEAAARALGEIITKQKGKDGKGRPRIYTKSKKQEQKEAANAAAKDQGKRKSAGAKMTIERPKTDANGYQAPIFESTTSQTVPSDETHANEGKAVGKNVPFVEMQRPSNREHKSHARDLGLTKESAKELLDMVTPTKLKPVKLRNSNAKNNLKVSTEEGYDQEAAMSEMSKLFKKVVTPKGQKVALQGAQTKMATRDKIRTLALKGLLTENKDTAKEKLVGKNVESGSRKPWALKPHGAANEDDNATPTENRTAKVIDVENQDTPSPSHMTLPLKDGSGSEEPFTPIQRNKAKSSGTTRELSVLTNGSEKKKPFQGNQYLYSDRTPRLNPDGTPVTRKSQGIRGQ